MILVKLCDLSGYPAGTVAATDAPVADSIEAADMAEAFEYAAAFGDEYQVSFEAAEVVA